MSGLFGDLPDLAVAKPYRFTSGGAECRDRSGEDANYYPTPPWASRAGVELIKAIDPSASWVWEPACGGGHMAEVLRESFDQVLATDLIDHGYGGRHGNLLDFCSDAAAGYTEADWIITNPPFKLGEEFVRQGWKLARRGVAVLCRLQFIEGVGRAGLHFPASEYGNLSEPRLSYLAPFCERVAMVRGRYDPKASTNMAYAWFIYDKAPHGDPCAVVPILPGTRERLTHPHDAIKFGGGL